MPTNATTQLISEIPELARLPKEEQERVLSLCWMSEPVQTPLQRYGSRPFQLPIVVVGPIIIYSVYAKMSFGLTMLLVMPVWWIGFVILRRPYRKRLVSVLRATVASYLQDGIIPKPAEKETPAPTPRMRRLYVWLAILLLIPLLMFVRTKERQRDETINVDRDNAEMTAAIVRARATLPQFWQVFDHPERGERDFALKVGITDGNGTEHFWANETARTNGQTMGTISNGPSIVRRVKLGDRIVIPDADISDWTYMRDGKMVGNYTLQALFKKMPAGEVEGYKQMMSDP